jgi:hypothetical protein
MKKVFFFLAFLLFLVVSCSNQNENEPNKPNEQQGDSSSSALISSSSDITLPSSSSDITLPSSSDGGATLSSSSSSKSNPPPSGAALTCADPVSTTATNYSDMNNWSVYTAEDKLTKDVDIFLLYPTSIQSSAAEDCPYANINNSSMRRAVDQWYSGIKTVVTSNANVYLPYYRQANVFGSGCSGANMTGGAAMEDVIASFQYYLTHINKGQRPYMMLGFSQGSSPLWELAENRLEKICGTEFGAANRKNHIVTYATGIPGHGKIAATKPVKFSESYNDINVITAWNPYEEADTLCTSSQLGVHGSNGAPTTNPITWTIDEDYHLMTENPKLNQNTILGARSYNKLGILLVRKAKNPSTNCGASGNMYMGMHGQDISLFSASIIQNMQDRIDAWKEKYR